MERRLQDRVQRYGWDRAAHAYEAGWSDQLRPGQALMMEMAAPRPGEHALEVAAGTGLVTVQLSDAVGPEGSVLATDISDFMIAQAADAIGDRGNVTFARVAAEDIEVGERRFDLAVCAFGLMYVADPAAALACMREALGEDGRIALAVWGARANCGWASVFPITEAKVRSDVCPLFFRLGTGDSLHLELEAAGFHRVEARRISTTLRYESGEAAVSAAFVGGPVAMAYARFSTEVKALVAQEYLASIEPYRSGGGYEIPGEFVVALGHNQP